MALWRALCCQSFPDIIYFRNINVNCTVNIGKQNYENVPKDRKAKTS